MKKDDYKIAFLENTKDWSFSFAPGRIEFLGNHLDYNGGDVLGMAVNAGIYCLGVPDSENKPHENTTGKNRFSLFSECFEDAVLEGQLDNIQRQDGKFAWTNYCLGVLKELQARDLAPSEGFRLIFTSNLPTSVGLSSSAALELASALTILQLAGKSLPTKELAGLCRSAENQFVGLPCGILDQGTSAFGKKDHLVHIDCNEEFFSNLPIPSDTKVWIFNTGIKHDLVDSLYSTRHQECVDALEIGKKSYPENDRLTKFTPEQIQSLSLPENLKKRAIHISQEQKRVLAFRNGLAEGLGPSELGKLLAESHNSSSLNFENSCLELDYLSHELNRLPEVYGARLTGGGFGGAVMAWTSKSFSQTNAQEIVSAYKENFNETIDWHQFEPSDGARIENLLEQPG